MNFKRPVLMSVLWLPVLLLIVWLLFGMISGRQHTPDAPQTVAEKQAVTPTNSAKPQTTLLFPEKELYGEYYMGDGLGTNCTLTLTANHRFTFEWTGSIMMCDGKGNCHINVHDSNTGVWEMQRDVAVMRPEKPNIRDGMRGMATRLVPVKYGQHRYLIDEDQMFAFCVAARDATHRKPIDDYDELHTIYYIHEKDGKPVSAPGKSLLPARYMEFYRQGPVAAKVARIDAQGRAILNVGAANRVKIGMLFTVTSWDGVDLKVLSVKGHEAVCKVMYRWDSREWVKVGAACTTGTEDDRPAGIGSQAYETPPEAETPATK